jgi:hypothetical protein
MANKRHCDCETKLRNGTTIRGSSTPITAIPMQQSIGVMGYM